VGRYGGEEFLVILPECRLDDAQQVLDDIRRRFADISFSCNGQHFGVTISAGVASMPAFRQAQDLLAAADKALYQAKQSGRNQICTIGLEEVRR
jgi:diguanylate cyclase (GGDEF)-like protein